MTADIRERVREYVGKLVDVESARLVELGVYNFTIRSAKERNIPRLWADDTFRALYVRKAHSVSANLDGASYLGNTDLRHRVQSGEISPYDLASAKPEALNPGIWKDSKAKLLAKEEKAMKPEVVAKSTRFVCRACGKRETRYAEVQLRSGDEATTILIKCLFCGNAWRIG
jgi:DNA-directed RNA polymerase subunit M/transcription elongation factor TFIIS